MIASRIQLIEYQIYLTNILSYDFEDIIDIDILELNDFINKE